MVVVDRFVKSVIEPSSREVGWFKPNPDGSFDLHLWGVNGWAKVNNFVEKKYAKIIAKVSIDSEEEYPGNIFTFILSDERNHEVEIQNTSNGTIEIVVDITDKAPGHHGFSLEQKIDSEDEAVSYDNEVFFISLTIAEDKSYTIVYENSDDIEVEEVEFINELIPGEEEPEEE